MLWLGRTILAANVWLTAIMTLVAGCPRFDCRCPDGSIKPFGLGFMSRAAGCCCDESPPAVPRRRVVAESDRSLPPCCRHKHHPPVFGADSRSQIEHPGCTKTLVDPEPYTSSAARVQISEDTSAQPSLAIPAANLPSAAVAIAICSTGWSDPILPNADRLHLLQRLII
jgi:hypothetical protein